ncbi:MAG: hypothetical protein DHS20C15_11320 [Planctomycetota bacterium]|nr:MAG: hypothetical protein DHS20C15_11320 [Planctomycetota bacterium]
MARITTECLLIGRLPESPALLRLARACEAAGLNVRRVDVAGALPARVDRPDTGPPPARFLRLPSGTPPQELAALLATRDAERGPPGVWLDAPEHVARAQHKARQLACLAAAGLPVPPTLLVGRDGRVPEGELPGEKLVLKPVFGAAGRGVEVALPRAEALRRAADFARLSTPVLVQPWLGGGVDRRVFLVDGECVAGMERRPHAADGRGNAARGADTANWRPDDAQLELARRAASALGLAIAGVDLLESDTGPVVLEVNACPGFAALEACSGVDVAGALAAALRRRVAPV